MRLYLIFCLTLLAGCGHEPALSLLDLSPCPGWQGAPPLTEAQFARAAAAERAGRLCANAKLEGVGEAARR
ncbi:hypothetical protein SAMN05443573_1228 [Celeribacter indicus]|nr:hypothetical protein SAMN05443573_1228 [Celeribacter indicus]